MLRKFGRVLLFILTAVAVTFVLNRLGTLQGMEHLVLDKEQSLAEHESKDIVVVDITDADYDNQFGGQSPLNPGKLIELLGAINQNDPAVIAVDIDTSHPQFSNKDFEIEQPLKDKVIWEREVSLSPADHEASAPLDVLGGRDPSLNQYSGVPELLDDPEDKVTRFYARCVETNAGMKPSFVYAVAAAYRVRPRSGPPPGMPECPSGAQDPTQPFLINFPLRPGSTLAFRDAAQVLGLTSNSASGAVTNALPEFQGKIILVGGTYRDFDRHYTPIGLLPGVAVLANAIETELQGNPVKARSYLLLFLVELLSGLLLFAVLSRMHSFAAAIALGSVMAIVIPLALSFALFHTPSRFFVFVPTLVAVLAYEILEHVRHRSLEPILGPRREH